MNSSDYLDSLKTELNLVSDYAIAKALGVTRFRVSNWRRTRREMDVDVLPRVAELLKKDPLIVYADIAASRTKDPFERACLEKLAELARNQNRTVKGMSEGRLLSVTYEECNCRTQ